MEHEPGAPLGAAATLVRVIDEGGQARALVRLSFDPADITTDAEAVVSEVPGPGGRAAGRAVARTTLRGGEPRTMVVESGLERGKENHLYYRVEARGADDRRIDTLLYLRVNLDESLEPRQVDETLEYAGVPAGEVAP